MLRMGLIFLKKITLLFLLISVSLLSTSLAGRQWTYVDNSAIKTTNEETTRKSMEREDEALAEVHERLLRANRNDYSNYSPTPTFVKPPYKLIPN